ncbi:response regulator [Terrimonas sp. NA20]|uniref:Response regulator n=1 Tax=Terrimonas ginsenosidimutans TaxID=2908004 RepID=A0ABS9KS66_9BACT|nr:response regulator [Terrimonas ginsenosidimutans]MCG2615148.1 response regulator [Terrimonas ginsenosidimutans]
MNNNETIRILLVDDDEDDRADFIAVFAGLRMNTFVETLKDGVALMNYLMNDAAKLPHILFLDLNMPKKSGLECLIAIKKIDRLKDLTIAIYSTSSSQKDIEDTFVNGANIYIRKPTHPTMLKKILMHVLAINWQYHTSGLNKDNFLLQL